MTKIFIIGITVIIVAGFGPIAIIWGLNTLFNLSIAYTLKTWAAALVLGGAVGGSKTS